MINGNSHQLGETVSMAADTKASDTGLSHDTFTAMVGQMVVQCKALLRQQLEHKATKQPLLYDQERIGRIMAEFEAGSADIQDAIAARVMSRLTHHVQQEVMRVLQDALSPQDEAAGRTVVPHSRNRGHDASRPAESFLLRLAYATPPA